MSKMNPVIHFRVTIRKAAPGADEVISYQMSAFKTNGIWV